MKNLLDIISKNSSSNVIVPIVALASILIVILFYVFSKKKWLKYAISVFIVFIGGILLVRGYQSIIKPGGLNTILIAGNTIVFGFVGIFTSLIFDTIDSIIKNIRLYRKKRKYTKRGN